MEGLISWWNRRKEKWKRFWTEKGHGSKQVGKAAYLKRIVCGRVLLHSFFSLETNALDAILLIMIKLKKEDLNTFTVQMRKLWVRSLIVSGCINRMYKDKLYGWIWRWVSIKKKEKLMNGKIVRLWWDCFTVMREFCFETSIPWIGRQ